MVNELLDRIREITANRERLRGLLAAVVGISQDLELPAMLDRTVTAAAELVGARYAALGVIGPQGQLVARHTHGMTEEERQQIGTMPDGHGILGLLIEEPKPTRITDITAHPRAYGFPPNHPPMRSFLGVPVRIRDVLFANLYLTEKIGAASFTDDDEEIATALAAAAGVAIENAQLYEEGRRRQRWLEVSAEITESLLGEVNQHAALELVAERALETAGASLAMVLLRDERFPGRLVIEVSTGADAPPIEGATVTMADDVLDAVVNERRHALVDDLGKVTQWPTTVDSGPAVLVPLATAETVYGVIAVATKRGTPEVYTPTDVGLVESFAGQAALAMERARSQHERALLAVLEDRERIARDLHDLVIQRLFATGLFLQSTLRLAIRPEVTRRLKQAIDDVDATIREIRTSIFELRAPTEEDLRTQIRAVIEEARVPLGFTPSLNVNGPVEHAVPEELRPDFLAALREALTNIARHAEADQASVTVHATGDRLRLIVTDNGRGPGDLKPRGGLRNLRERAAQHGGDFSVSPAEDGGTVLRWEVPLRR